MSQQEIERLFQPSIFNGLLDSARSLGFPGSWSGSAFRSHPCGVIQGTLKLTNHWHVDGHCSIHITDGDGWDVEHICRDSFGRGNPHPKPINGVSILAWSNGRWQSDEIRQKVEPTAVALLSRLRDFVLAKEAEKTMVNAQHDYCVRELRDKTVKAALSKLETRI